jgi:murein DD-endopeptidase / murein LD-carboxypeptidase
MKLMLRLVCGFVLLMLVACHSSRRVTVTIGGENAPALPGNRTPAKSVAPRTINTKNISPDALVNFAETLQGVPYKYGSAKKEDGFDCSGFITYVFNHFNISVPRTSTDFTNAGTAVTLKDSKRGDLILFTGSDTTGWKVGHMGIITENRRGKVKFIHSASGHKQGVTISDVIGYYITHYVKVIRVFRI